MNDNFDFNNPNEAPEPECSMPPLELKGHKKNFSKIALALLFNVLAIEIVATIAVLIINSINPTLLESTSYSLIFSAIIQYGIGFPLFALMLRSVPKVKPPKSSISFGSFFKYLAIAMFVMYVGNYLSQIVMMLVDAIFGTVPENSVDVLLSSSTFVINLLIVGIIGPIFEELMFRKLLIDRLTPYGEIFAIALSGFIFGLFHGNLYQFFYAFFIGAVLGYIYLKTGKIIYSVIIHIFINIFCGVLPSAVQSSFNMEEMLELFESGQLTDAYLMENALPIVALAFIMSIQYALIITGVIMLSRNFKNIKLNPGRVTFPKGTVANTVFMNAGMIILLAYLFLTIALNTIPLG